jgi:hypothetical protein
MTQNPYRLARDIRGIGFKTADAIAVKSHRTPTPRFAAKNDPCDGAETGGAEPQIAEQSRSWRAEIGEREVMRGS